MNSLIWIVSASAGGAVALTITAIWHFMRRATVISQSSKMRSRIEVFTGVNARVFVNEKIRQRRRVLNVIFKLARSTLTHKMRDSLVRRLSKAGEFEIHLVERIAAIKLGFATLGLLLGTTASITLGPSWLILIPVLSTLAYFGPDLYVYDMSVRRAERMSLELPELIDLLYLCVSSGISLNSAMQKVADNQSGAAAGELTRVLEEMRLGISRVDAFHALAARVAQPDMIRFAESIIKTDQLGISLTAVLGEQAKEMRLRRHALAREKAQRVSVKILLPLVVCFLPGLFIVVLGPAVTSIIKLFG